MSCYRIYYQNGSKRMKPVSNADEYKALRDSRENISLLEAARMGNKLAKSKLLQMNYSCYPNEEMKLKGSHYPSASVGMDVDFDKSRPDYDELMKNIPDTILAKKDEIGLLMLERSVNKGFHLVFKRIEGKTQEENLRFVSCKLGVAFDEGAKDITRVFFTTGCADLLYLSDELFADNEPKPIDIEKAKKEFESAIEQYKQSRSSSAAETEEEDIPEMEGTLHDIMLSVLPPACYEDRVNGHLIGDIIENFFVLFNNGHAPQQGNRNSLTFELARALRCVVDYRIDKLKKYIPRFANFDAGEWEITLQNANNEPRKGINYKMQRILQSLEQITPVDKNSKSALQSELPPQLPKKLPYPLDVISSRVPDYYRPAVCEGVFPSLAAHLHGVKFLYWDNVEHEATFMNVLVAPMSTGKGCIRKPIQIILEDLVKKDVQNRIREGEWKLANQGKNKKATPRPDDICIQVLIDNLTDAVFNQRVVDAHRNGQRYLFTQCDELDTLKQLTSRGTPEQVSILIRKAFDNSDHGQERVGAESVTGIAPLRFNFNASTTIPNCRRFFYRGVNDGTVTRLSMSTIIKPVDAPRPVFKEYDDEYKEAIRRVVETLDKKVGVYQSGKANKFIEKLMDENETLSDLYGSESYLVMSYRATVIAWLKGMVLYLLNDEKWTKQIEEYISWSLRYDLWCKMKIFGAQMEGEIQEEKTDASPMRSNNLLTLLPASFTLEQVASLKKPSGAAVSRPLDLVRKWQARGYVDFNEETKVITKKM